jgi:S-methylmethionine-dependent homocysteine/selenocysteine methylase
MTRMSLPLSLILFGVMLSPVPSAAVEKLNCPFIFTSVTPSKLERIKALLPDANAMGSVGRLNSTIDTLRREGMAKSQIVSHLVGAYCPMVAQESSLTEAEKAAKVRRFAGQITQLVYSLESGLDVIINVPLAPDVVDALNATARKQGLSGPAWIAMTVENALQRQ